MGNPVPRRKILPPPRLHRLRRPEKILEAAPSSCKNLHRIFQSSIDFIETLSQLLVLLFLFST